MVCWVGFKCGVVLVERCSPLEGFRFSLNNKN